MPRRACSNSASLRSCDQNAIRRRRSAEITCANASLPKGGTIVASLTQMANQTKTAGSVTGLHRATESASLLGCLQQWRRTGAELLQQSALIRLGGFEMTLLDMTEATDLFRDRRKADRQVMVLRGELGKDLLKQAFIVADQRPFGLALGGVAERIERGAAQEFQSCQQPEQAEDPRPKSHLARNAGDLVFGREQGRRKVDVVAHVLATERIAHLPLE